MPKASLAGKVALVLGSAKNMGAAIAVALAKEGAKVAVHYRSSEKEAMSTFGKVKSLSPGSILAKCDIENESELKALFSQIEKEYGRLDMLVNCVGDFIWKKMSETSREELESVMRNNMLSAYSAMKAALPLMRKNCFGRIINFGSAGSERIMVREMTSPYYAAKTGLYMISKSLSSECIRDGITINMVSPGMLATSVAGPGIDKMPAGRYAEFGDIVNAVMFLISEKSSYITGANIEVAGGWWPDMG